MYKQILVPVDLTHVDQLGKALKTAADLSRHYDAPVCYVGVTSEAPSPVAHNPKEFAQKLEAFATSRQASTASPPRRAPTARRIRQSTSTGS